MKELTPEEISQNWERFVGLLEKLGDRAPAATKMCEVLSEHLALCPASKKESYHLPIPGGLVDHSLRVLGNALKIAKAFNWELPRDSLIIACLFHDLGKVGMVEEDGSIVDYYIPQDSEWHRTKLGEFYKINENIKYMTVPDRGVFLCQWFGLRLNRDETLSILLNDGQYADENRPYRMKEPLLTMVVHMADVIATKQEKGDIP